MITKTYFKDRRTGSVYVTTEKTLPVAGKIPLKAAYREDTSWIDRDHLDAVTDPHAPTTGRTVGQLMILLLVLAVWVLVAVQTHNEFHVSMGAALWLQGGWSLVLFSVLLRWSGSVHH
jgi:hypothetical protein